MSDERKVVARGGVSKLLRQEAGVAPRTAAIYARTASSLDGSAGVYDQVQSCRQCAIKLGVEVARIYEHVGVAGGGNPRSDLHHLMADAEAGEFDILIIKDIYRLSRSAAHLYDVLSVLADLTVPVHAVVGGPVHIIDAAYVGHFAEIDCEAKRAAWRLRKLRGCRSPVPGVERV